MTKELLFLKPNQRRGSKPRCHWITHGEPSDVASRLTKLIAPHGVVSASDCWMPKGFVEIAEAELDKATCLLGSQPCEELGSWWLGRPHSKEKTPSFDIASTCTVDNKPALLLVEAKAHEEELTKESIGKRLPSASTDSRLNHDRIGSCIQESILDMASETHMPWALSRDRNYQMSNRFAWSWKVAQLGRPVILVYLGFLNAADMTEDGKGGSNVLFDSPNAWRTCVLTHSREIVPPTIWDRRWVCG